MKEIVNNYSQEKTNENKITKYLVKTESNGKHKIRDLIATIGVPDEIKKINQSIVKN